MAVYKYILPANDKHGEQIRWEVQTYMHEYTGERKKIHKRGFLTQREAKEWERRLKATGHGIWKIDFETFVGMYFEDMENRLRYNTIRSKKYIIDLKIIPYFGKRKIAEISAPDIRKWQNELKKENYAPTYLKTINNQLNAIFNYAVRYYDLPSNPCRKAGSMGKSNAKEMEYWTQEEFEEFLDCVSEKPFSYYGFLILFWCGLRIGELLALTIQDIDFKEKTLTVNKSCQFIHGERVITATKTEKSNRVISVPDTLISELYDFVGKLYGLQKTDFLFDVSKSYFEHELIRGVQISGVKKIRLHDIRHSHV